jgi:hypothetical protein
MAEGRDSGIGANASIGTDAGVVTNGGTRKHTLDYWAEPVII